MSLKQAIDGKCQFGPDLRIAAHDLCMALGIPDLTVRALTNFIKENYSEVKYGQRIRDHQNKSQNGYIGIGLKSSEPEPVFPPKKPVNAPNNKTGCATTNESKKQLYMHENIKRLAGLMGKGAKEILRYFAEGQVSWVFDKNGNIDFPKSASYSNSLIDADVRRKQLLAQQIQQPQQQQPTITLAPPVSIHQPQPRPPCLPPPRILSPPRATVPLVQVLPMDRTTTASPVVLKIVPPPLDGPTVATTNPEVQTLRREPSSPSADEMFTAGVTALRDLFVPEEPLNEPPYGKLDMTAYNTWGEWRDKMRAYNHYKWTAAKNPSDKNKWVQRKDALDKRDEDYDKLMIPVFTDEFN